MSDAVTGDLNISRNQQMNPQAGEGQINQPHPRGLKGMIGDGINSLKHSVEQSATNKLQGEAHGLLNGIGGHVGLPRVGGGGIFGGLINKAEGAIEQNIRNQADRYAQNQINERMGQGGNPNVPMDYSQSATRPGVAGQDVTAQQAPKDVQQAPVVQKDVHGSIQQPVSDVPSTGSVKTQAMDTKQQANHKTETSLDTNTNNLYKTTTTAEVPKPGTTAQTSAVRTDSSGSSVTDSSWLYAPRKSMSEIYAEQERQRIHDLNEKYKQKKQ